MNDVYFDKLSRRAVAPDSVRAKGPLTDPKTFGVFELPASSGAVRRFRMGSYPIRLIELAEDFRVLNRLEYLMVVVAQLRKRLSQTAGKIKNG